MPPENASPTLDAALDLLPLPDHNDLSEQQVRGITCVWDGIALTAETAVDLGPRKVKRLDGHFDWFPRGCRQCVGRHAYEFLFGHAENCEHCASRTDCPTAVEVRRLMREGRR